MNSIDIGFGVSIGVFIVSFILKMMGVLILDIMWIPVLAIMSGFIVSIGGIICEMILDGNVDKDEFE